MTIKKVVTWVTSDGIEFNDISKAEKHKLFINKQVAKRVEIIAMQKLERHFTRHVIDSPQELEKLKQEIINKYESECIMRHDIYYWGIPEPPKIISITIEDE